MSFFGARGEWKGGELKGVNWVGRWGVHLGAIVVVAGSEIHCPPMCMDGCCFPYFVLLYPSYLFGRTCSYIGHLFHVGHFLRQS